MNPSRVQERKWLRKQRRFARVQKRKEIGRPPKAGRDYHHLTPTSRQGEETKQNLLLIKLERHVAWHKLWGNQTAEEVLALLERVVRAKKHQR